ncbi:MAG: hypothetical protein HYV35_12945 [Lentisphaerae bacterium]|nr:hypothetical protein [Lentisphaerota bacterium]
MKPRRFFLFLSFWLAMMATPAWAESFPSRPTLAEMDQMMVLGTASGHAVRERALALKSNWSALPYSGIRATYFATLQQVLQTLAPQYIDSVSGPLTAGGNNFLYYTLTSWRSAAGLNASGFRRYGAEGNPVGYGLAQSNDVFRAPAFEEVAAGFRALSWTLQSASLVQGKWKNIPGSIGKDTNECAVALSINRILWLNTWNNGFSWGSSVYYCGYLFGEDFVYAQVGARSGRQRGKCSATVPTMRPCSASVYAQCRKDFNTSYFIMLDGLPGTEGQMIEIASFPETSEAVRLTDEIGGYEANPLDIIGAACPYSDVSAGGGYFDCRYLLRWNFTPY